MGVFGPPLIPFLSLIKPRVRRPGPGSESAQPDSESVSPSLGLTWGSESRIPDPSQPAAELDPLLVRAMPFSPRMFQPLGRQVHSTTTRG